MWSLKKSGWHLLKKIQRARIRKKSKTEFLKISNSSGISSKTEDNTIIRQLFLRALFTFFVIASQKLTLTCEADQFLSSCKLLLAVWNIDIYKVQSFPSATWTLIFNRESNFKCALLLTRILTFSGSVLRRNVRAVLFVVSSLMHLHAELRTVTESFTG